MRLTALLALLPLLAAPAFAQEEATFSSGIQVVNILATVRDRSEQFVRNLTKDDFAVSEDGRPQTIRYFSAETNLPLTIGLLVDTSLSQEKVLNAERGASFRFVDSVLRENMDHVFLMDFDMNVRTMQHLTNSRADLQESLRLVNTPTREELRSQYGGGTLLFDAVSDACKEVMIKQQGRKALIILSDGGDNGSNATLASAVQEAQRANTLVYTILFTSGGGFGSNLGKRNMLRLAEQTGGSYFVVTKQLTIDQVFAHIEEDLRSQYSIGFVSDKPAQVSEFRKLQLTTKRSQLTVHARDRYWAGPAQ
ncbi:MAG TPA: VWA domain-containing protein [Bryobacteraceae bacterium]|nr:VWA domain-containing protein [Bryobacteraceae bacterium]